MIWKLKFALFDVLQIPTNQVMIRSVLSKFNWLSIIQRSTVQQRPSFSASFLWSNYTKILKLQAPPNHRLNLKLRGAAALTKRLCPGGLNCTNWAPTVGWDRTIGRWVPGQSSSRKPSTSNIRTCWLSSTLQPRRTWSPSWGSNCVLFDRFLSWHQIHLKASETKVQV